MSLSEREVARAMEEAGVEDWQPGQADPGRSPDPPSPASESASPEKTLAPAGRSRDGSSVGAVEAPSAPRADAYGDQEAGEGAGQVR
jgi:hypothetical protein